MTQANSCYLYPHISSILKYASLSINGAILRHISGYDDRANDLISEAAILNWSHMPQTKFCVINVIHFVIINNAIDYKYSWRGAITGFFMPIKSIQSQ